MPTNVHNELFRGFGLVIVFKYRMDLSVRSGGWGTAEVKWEVEQKIWSCT